MRRSWDGFRRRLWYLRAVFDIESESPPCTNWTGEGPDGGPTGSEQYSDSVLWGDQSRTLSAPAGMLRGESRQGVVYLAVFHTDQPSFERWRAYVTHSEPDKAAPVRSGTTPSEPARTPGFPLGPSDPSSDQAVADVGRTAASGGDVRRWQRVPPETGERVPFEPEMVAITAGTCAPRSAVGTPPGTGTAVSGSAWPGPLPLESLNLYLLWGSMGHRPLLVS